MARRCRSPRTNLASPSEIFVSASDGSGLRQVTHTNEALLGEAGNECGGKFLVRRGGGYTCAGDAYFVRRNLMLRKISAAGVVAWRAADDVVECLVLPLECTGIFLEPAM